MICIEVCRGELTLFSDATDDAVSIQMHTVNSEVQGITLDEFMNVLRELKDKLGDSYRKPLPHTPNPYKHI